MPKTSRNETAFFQSPLTLFSFRLLCLTFTPCTGRHIYSPSWICTNLPFGHVWSTVPISGVVTPRSHGLDLLDRVQVQVVSLLGSGLSSDLQASSHRRYVTNEKCPSELADLVPPKRLNVDALTFLSRCIVNINSPMYSFFPCTTSLCNSLINERFPPDYDLTPFKGGFFSLHREKLP